MASSPVETVALAALASAPGAPGAQYAATAHSHDAKNMKTQAHFFKTPPVKK
jgi:hypothetical protein